MKIWLALALSTLASPLARADEPISALCQTKLLKVTTDAFLREFSAHAAKFGYIQQVTFNYNMDGTPRTVFFGSKQGDNAHRCLVQVYTRPGPTGADGCPDYTFDYIDSNCR